MPRIMRVSLTEEPVVSRTKTVTRRLGWWEDRHGRRILLPGQQLTLVRKSMGRRPGEPLVRLADVQVVDVRRERLCDITPDDVAREGFPGWSRERFVSYFCDHMRCKPDTAVTRIEWRYLDGTVDR